MTAYAESVRGAVPVESLGFVLSHEHVFLRSPGFAENYPRTFPREEVVTIASRDLRGYREKGVSTIVDMTTVDLGRDVSILAEVSRASGVNIIAATGSYTGIPTFFQPRSAERIAELFIADLTEGVAGTAIKAGVIKPGSTER